MVTRKDVALRAGVSEATVSYVVNNGPRMVAPETRQRVLQTIQDLDYHPNDVARSLRKQSTATIGLVIPDSANPFYGELARSIENVGYANEYTVVLCNSNFEAAREADYVQMLISKRAAGVIIIPTAPGNVAALLKADIRTVVLEHEIDGVDCIVIDDYTGGLLVTQHLLSLGHRHIACIARLDDQSSSHKRVDGYKAALLAANVPINPGLIVEIGPRIADGEAATLRLLDQPPPPTAIFAHNDAIALGVLSALRKRGLNVPGDVSVVGYDNIEQAAYITPPLTTVAYPTALMGELAAKRLIDLIQDSAAGPIQPSVLEVTLIKRESTGVAVSS